DLPSPSDGPIPVYLAETLEEEEVEEEPAADALPVAPRRELRVLYRLDAPGGDLEHGLVTLLLAEAWGVAAPPPALVDGLLGHVSQRARPQERDRVDAALAEARKAGRPVGLATLFDRTDEVGSALGLALYAQAATSLVTYLLKSGPPASFRTFVEK